MDNARATLTLYPKRSSAMWLLLACSAFVAIGIWMGLDGDWVGWLCAGFFGLGLPIAIVQLIPGSTYLKLTPSGFAYSNLFRVTAVSWSDVDEFFVVEQAGVGVHRMVGFNFVPSYDRARLGRRIASAIGNCEGALPDTYGKNVDELAALLNEHLASAKETKSSESGELW